LASYLSDFAKPNAFQIVLKVSLMAAGTSARSLSIMISGNTIVSSRMGPAL